MLALAKACAVLLTFFENLQVVCNIEPSNFLPTNGLQLERRMYSRTVPGNYTIEQHYTACQQIMRTVSPGGGLPMEMNMSFTPLMKCCNTNIGTQLRMEMNCFPLVYLSSYLLQNVATQTSAHK